VTPSFPARSAHDLIRMAREKLGGISYATGGFGSSSHFAVAPFSFLSGAKFSFEFRFSCRSRIDVSRCAIGARHPRRPGVVVVLIPAHDSGVAVSETLPIDRY
jgi:hypothetical protein